MQLRSFIFLGLCAALGMSSAAYAGAPAGITAPQSVSTTDVISVAARSDAAQLRILKRKKKPTDEDVAQIKQLEAKIAAARASARVKAIEAKKLAMREAAKARSAARREAFLSSKGRESAAPAKVAKVSDAKPATKHGLARFFAPVDPIPTIDSKPASDPIPAEAMNVAMTGNNGELRSEGREQTRNGSGLFAGLFGGATSSSMTMLPETRALDSVLEKKQAASKFKVKPEFEPQEVDFSGYSAGTIVIDTSARRLYLVDSPFTARRYAIAVGRDGLQFKGTVAVGDKQEWPRWIPTLDMQKREPSHYAQYKDGMAGGPSNPLGARAIYLYQGKTDTHLRIHGTNQPQSIGTSASNGCFRMINEHVMDLYRRVKMGTKVVII